MSTPLITIEGAVQFTGRGDVMLTEKALHCTPEQLREFIRLAFEHSRDKLLVDAANRGSGPFAPYFSLDFTEYLSLLLEFSRPVKERLSKQRSVFVTYNPRLPIPKQDAA